jgi:predicted nucleic acid-binding protein
LILARIIVLDAGPLGDACRKRGNEDVERLTLWLHQAMANGAMLAIPEIADYEVRRGLLWAGADDGVRRLDLLRVDLRHYIPITTAAMRKAAKLWAGARRKGIGTSDEKEIDADVILAAQALEFTGLGSKVLSRIPAVRDMAPAPSAGEAEPIVRVAVRRCVPVTVRRADVCRSMVP